MDFMAQCLDCDSGRITMEFSDFGEREEYVEEHRAAGCRVKQWIAFGGGR